MAVVMDTSSASHHHLAIKAVVPIPVDQLVADIDNTDIEWAFGYCGFIVLRVRGASHLIELHWRREILPLLVTALDEPTRCAAAHYLLVCAVRPRIPTKYNWDGIEFGRDMVPIVDDKDRRSIKEVWKKRLANLALIEALSGL
jgi:hypothetical protein